MADRKTQDVAAVITWLDDWAPHLAENGGLTIASLVSVTASGGAVVSATSNTTTSVSFKLTTSGVSTVPSDVVVTVKVTLSNGDTDVRHHTIGVTND